MNKVGGSLSRHRRGKGQKEDMANQEQYFAKARSWQREKAKTNPLTLSAANFVPKYPAVSDAATKVVRLSSPFSTKDHLVGTSGLEAERRRLLKEEDFMQTKLPNLSMVKPTQKINHSTAARQVVGQQRQSANSTSHREIQPNVGGQRGNRKRRLSQITSPPVDTPIRIRVGSVNYQWSEAGNSIRDPTYNSSSPSRSADEIRFIASTTGNTSHAIGKSLTELSSSAISPLPWFSPGNNRPAYRRRFSDPKQHIKRAASAKSQCPMTAYTDALSPRPPTSMSPASSVSSMTVEVGNGQESPKIGIDEEDIWRAWLNHDMPEFQVAKKQQDPAADIGRPLPTPVPQGLAIATLPIQADRESALQEPSVKLKRRFGGRP